MELLYDARERDVAMAVSATWSSTTLAQRRSPMAPARYPALYLRRRRRRVAQLFPRTAVASEFLERISWRSWARASASAWHNVARRAGAAPARNASRPGPSPRRSSAPGGCSARASAALGAQPFNVATAFCRRSDARPPHGEVGSCTATTSPARRASPRRRAAPAPTRSSVPRRPSRRRPAPLSRRGGARARPRPALPRLGDMPRAGPAIKRAGISVGRDPLLLAEGARARRRAQLDREPLELVQLGHGGELLRSCRARRGARAPPCHVALPAWRRPPRAHGSRASARARPRRPTRARRP